MEADFLSPVDPRWQRFLESVPHDIYHRPEYCAVAATYEGGVPTAFFAEVEDGKILIPLLARDLPPRIGAPSDWRDLTTPYGYSSPLVRGSSSEVVRRCFELFIETGRDFGFISAFLRLHPLLPVTGEEPCPCGDVVRHGKCVYIDLTPSEEEVWRRMRSNHRRQIKRLARDGFTEEFDRWEDLDRFVQVYYETMKRIGASHFYFFEPSYFHALRASLGDSIHLCTVRSPGGEIAAAGLFFTCSGLLQYHLGGTAESFLDQAPSKLLLDAVRRWGQRGGYRVFHLGGGVGGGDDSLFRFKSGFSELTADFHTCRLILDSSKYATLLEGCGAGVDHTFFPPYRKDQGHPTAAITERGPERRTVWATPPLRTEGSPSFP